MKPSDNDELTCILPIRRAKRMSPKMASAMENMTSPGKVLVSNPWPSVLQRDHEKKNKYELILKLQHDIFQLQIKIVDIVYVVYHN